MGLRIGIKTLRVPLDGDNGAVIIFQSLNQSVIGMGTCAETRSNLVNALVVVAVDVELQNA